MGAELYLVTPDGWAAERLLETLEPLLANGVHWLQYRDKHSDPGTRRALAVALRRLCSRHDCRLIINDDVTLALECAADGVHLGEADENLNAARQRLGPAAIIGSSCYNSLSRAQIAASAGANYLAFGAFFPSSTKPNARRASPDLLQQAAALQRPLCAIGGITASTAVDLVAAGADLIAVVSAVFDAADPAAEVRAFQWAMEEGWQRRTLRRHSDH